MSGWILEQMIGQGTFATVWKARKTVKGSVKVAAVKAIATDRLMPKLRQNLGSEVSILKRVVHVNVVKLHEVVEVRSYLLHGGADVCCPHMPLKGTVSLAFWLINFLLFQIRGHMILTYVQGFVNFHRQTAVTPVTPVLSAYRLEQPHLKFY